MAQICRLCKSEVPTLIRVCSNNCSYQRRESSYYEILRVSPNATQKEIREAYIKLSKELHPDSTSNKGNHVEFVKVNEAYNALTKRYKQDTKYGSGYTTNCHHHYGYGNSFRQWEYYNINYTKRGNKYSEEDRKRSVKWCMLLILTGIIIHAIHIKVTRDMIIRMAEEKSKIIQLGQERLAKEYENQTLENKLLHLVELMEKNESDIVEK